MGTTLHTIGVSNQRGFNLSLTDSTTKNKWCLRLIAKKHTLANHISRGKKLLTDKNFLRKPMYIWRRSYEARIYRTVFIWSALSREVAICLTSTWPPELCPSLRSSIKFWSFCGKSFSTINCFGRGWCSYTAWYNKFQWAINMIIHANTCFQMQLSAQKQIIEWMKRGANRQEKFNEKRVSYRLFFPPSLLWFDVLDSRW